MARVGLYPDAPKLPCVVGYEVSGVVDQIGEGVTGFELGERVMALCRFGGYSDVVALPSAQVLKLPERMSFEAGAAFPVVYLTAYNMLLFTGHLRPKSSVLILSAAGGVGLAAIQMARARGCEIFGSASPSKHEFLKTQGLSARARLAQDFVPQARRIVGARGIDLILDPVGGSSWSRAYDLLAPCGRLVAFGLSAVASGNTRSWLNAARQVLSIQRFSPAKLMDDNKTISGTNMGHLFSRPDLIAPQLVALLEMYEKPAARTARRSRVSVRGSKRRAPVHARSSGARQSPARALKPRASRPPAHKPVGGARGGRTSGTCAGST